jgi:hypothetical protein
LSRGDERAGVLVKKAFDQGCRLDAWTDYCRKDLWAELLELDKALVEEIQGEKSGEKPLPWNCILPGFSESFLKGEFIAAKNKDFTLPCIENCTHPCGICCKEHKIVENSIQYDNSHDEEHTAKSPDLAVSRHDPSLRRIVFSFVKEGGAVFLSHLGVMEVFSMALLRAGIPVLYTGGFNPLPKLEICAPLSVGINAGGEIADIDIAGTVEGSLFIRRMNNNLPGGIQIQKADTYTIPGGEKKYSLSSRLWGFTYAGDQGAVDYVKAGDEKNYRALRLGGGSVFGLRRLSVLAVDPENPDRGASFFKVFRFLYPRESPSN